MPSSPRFLRAAVVVATAALAFGAMSSRARAGDPAAELRISGDLGVLEGLVARFDHQRARRGSHVQRVRDLDARLSVIEAGLGLVGRPTRNRSDLGSLLADAALLGARVKAAWLAEVQAQAPEKDGPVEGFFVPAPPDPAAAPPKVPPAPPGGVKWPERISFAATGKMTWRPIGEWLLGPRNRSSWGPDFLRTGTEGEISFSLRARDLVREVRSAEVRVVVGLASPFAPRGGGFRVYDVTWKPERTLWNQALKTWMRHERITAAGPYGWTTEPKDASTSLEVQAHLRSVTLRDGTVVRFQAPEYVAK